MLPTESASEVAARLLTILDNYHVGADFVHTSAPKRRIDHKRENVFTRDAEGNRVIPTILRLTFRRLSLDRHSSNQMKYSILH